MLSPRSRAAARRVVLHALGSLVEDEAPQGLLAERHESQLESRWIVFCRLREVRPAEVWAPPMAVSRLLAEARWSISWAATSEITRSHRLTASSCSSVSPSPASVLRLKAAKRYASITMCSSSEASESRKMSFPVLDNDQAASTLLLSLTWSVDRTSCEESCAYPYR